MNHLADEGPSGAHLNFPMTPGGSVQDCTNGAQKQKLPYSLPYVESEPQKCLKQATLAIRLPSNGNNLWYG